MRVGGFNDGGNRTEEVRILPVQWLRGHFFPALIKLRATQATLLLILLLQKKVALEVQQLCNLYILPFASINLIFACDTHKISRSEGIEFLSAKLGIAVVANETFPVVTELRVSILLPPLPPFHGGLFHQLSFPFPHILFLSYAEDFFTENNSVTFCALS
jgi:hypothetical protein